MEMTKSVAKLGSGEGVIIDSSVLPCGIGIMSNILLLTSSHPPRTVSRPYCVCNLILIVLSCYSKRPVISPIYSMNSATIGRLGLASFFLLPHFCCHPCDADAYISEHRHRLESH